MRHVVPIVLLLVAAIHAVPLLGVVSAARLSSAYGISIDDPTLEILMRHRAVLFGILAAFLIFAAFQPQLHRVALVAAFVSAGSFVLLAQSVGGYNAPLATVVWMDVVAVALVVVGGVVHVLSPGVD
jgi:hypothetical protein